MGGKLGSKQRAKFLRSIFNIYNIFEKYNPPSHLNPSFWKVSLKTFLRELGISSDGVQTLEEMASIRGHPGPSSLLSRPLIYTRMT